MTETANSTMRITLLLTSLILGWGLSWPFAKIGLEYIPPTSFVLVRILIGMILFFILLAALKKLHWPKRREWPIILSVGINQIAFFSLLLTTGLSYVDASRSAILTYITPLWVFPIAHFFLKETLSKAKIFGILVGFIGVFILLNPLTLDYSDPQLLFGNGLLIGASFIWALQIIFLKHYKRPYSPLQLMPWKLLCAALTLLPFALLADGMPFIDWNLTVNFEMIFMVFFGGVITMAYCYWASIELNKLLPANTLSMSLLAVPVAGFASSILILGEPIIIGNILGLAFILLGIAIAFMRWRKNMQ